MSAKTPVESTQIGLIDDSIREVNTALNRGEAVDHPPGPIEAGRFHDGGPLKRGRSALFWDESFLWGIIALNTLSDLAFDFRPINADEIKQGMLEGYDIFIVPGGWARQKARALGEGGKECIRNFVRNGGSYLGFCGGAGLALDVKEGLSLVPLKRMDVRDRVPNFSGPIHVYAQEPRHPLWAGIESPSIFHVWWPSQFMYCKAESIKVLAVYGDPADDFFVADLNAKDINNSRTGWEPWEKEYGIRLDPINIKGEPAIVESSYGRGKVVLSYIHLETPDDTTGHLALFNLWQYLVSNSPSRSKDMGKACTKGLSSNRCVAISLDALKYADELEREMEDFVSFGIRNFLWYRRNGWLLQWKRGIMGLEYSTVYLMAKEIRKRIEERVQDGLHGSCEISRRLRSILNDSRQFLSMAKELLIQERYAMNTGKLHRFASPIQSIQVLRERLFADAMGTGGICRKLLVSMDGVLRLLF
nr:hypothetical protein [Desulfobacterales bacterium]